MKTVTLTNLVLLLSLMTLTSCVSKSDYDKVKKELEETKQELSKMKRNYESLLEEKKQEELERNRIPFISEAQALNYIKDFFDFYNKDMTYRNVVLRRISDNSFRVSLETCTNKGDFSNNDFFWTSSVRTLTVHSNGKYDFY